MDPVPSFVHNLKIKYIIYSNDFQSSYDAFRKTFQ